MIEPAEPGVEPTPISQYLQVLGASMIDKGNEEYIPTPKKKSAPSMKPRGIIIGAPAVHSALISEKEEPGLRGNGIIPCLLAYL